MARAIQRLNIKGLFLWENSKRNVEIEIQLVAPHEVDKLEELIAVFANVFEMEGFKQPDETHLRKLLNSSNFFAVIAKTEEKVVAGLTAYLLDQYYSEKPLAYVYDLAVLTAYQRKGIGTKLIEFTNQYCKHVGFEELFIQADKGDDHAIDFYRLTKPTREEQAVHFLYNFTKKTHPST